MKKFLSGIACVACAVALIAGCSSPSGGSGTTPQQLPVQAEIGYIAYQTSNGLYDAKENYDASYGTPIGIVFELDGDGNAKKIVSLKQSENTLQWAKYVNDEECAEGYATKFSTNETDGSGNWQIICDNVTDENTEGNYPAFEYCNGLTDGGKSWYLPALNELKAVYTNKAAINVAIGKLPIGTATELPSNGWFWSSSQSNSDERYACPISFNNGNQNDGTKYYVNNVRAVAGF